MSINHPVFFIVSNIRQNPPVLVVVIVAVELVLPDTPVTVTSPLPLIATEPDAVAVPAHVYKAE